jgi:hypothetical protein
MSKRQTDSKQMRVSNMQYEVLGQLSGELGISRVELLNNAVALVKFLVDNKAKSVKAICKDDEEKEVFLTMLLGNNDA